MAKSTFTVEEKYRILQAYREGYSSIKEITDPYGITKQTVYDWQRKYEHLGLEGLQPSKNWKRYTKEEKLQAIHDYLSGGYSLSEVTLRYNISSSSVLRKWLKKYNGQKDVNATGKRVNRPMTKGRVTTHEERIMIARACLENGKEYQPIAEHYHVSYQQVYQWTKKYEAGGEVALRDRRGRTKAEAELTPEEKAALQMKTLEQDNERLRAENAFLKKVEEIERRRK